jgi:hypothetical protein
VLHMASSAAACQAVWLTGLLTEILGESGMPPLLKIDNKSAIDLVRDRGGVSDLSVSGDNFDLVEDDLTIRLRRASPKRQCNR